MSNRTEDALGMPKSSLEAPTETIVVLGVPFAKVTQNETIETVEAMIRSGEPHYLATGNVDFLLQAWKDLELRRILHDADLVVCDSMPIVWISRLLGNPLPERVTGSDLTPALLAVAAEKDYSVFFLGGRPDIGEKAMENIRRTHPTLTKLHYYSPPNQPVLEMDHAAINQKIKDVRPDMLFVSFGCPKQEKWIAMNYLKTGVPMAVGVGATIDFLAGAVTRAPSWMGRCGLEWLYRMTREPKRLFKRYLMGILFFLIYIPRQILGLSTLAPARRNSPPKTESTESPASSTEIVWSDLCIPERFDAAAVASEEWDIDTESAPRILIDGSKVRFIDSTGIGKLIQFSKRLRKESRKMIILSPSDALNRALSLMQLTDLFTYANDLAEVRTIFRQLESHSTGQHRIASRTTDTKIEWQGEITAQTADDLWNEIERSLSADVLQPDNLTVKMASVTFVDSTGVGLMVRLKKRVSKNGGSVTFSELSPPVKNVLQHTNMTEYLTNHS